ncbi:hypothetical protein Pyrde_0964 [Pyrodictium delaneyi]|uniref:Uncharacterized protein n=1 Tax=Pyrodictium delaneyi TaxID=1273541 RepID=A0A0P0N2Y3_9CREN|nr:hypothetical protein Pyrde_0964 [Pyrodictium delaneyi]
MYGKLLQQLGLVRQACKLASLVSMVAFIASIVALLLNMPGLAIGSWLIAGATAATVSFPAAVYTERVAHLLVERVEEAETPPPRPPIDPLMAAAASIIAPPATALIVRSIVEWLASMIDWLVQVIPEAHVEVEKYEVTPIDKGVYAAGVLMMGLPALVDPLWRLLDQLTCLALRVLSVRDNSLRDKPCTSNLVEIVVWAKPLYNALDAKLFSEKWSIKD